MLAILRSGYSAPHELRAAAVGIEDGVRGSGIREGRRQPMERNGLADRISLSRRGGLGGGLALGLGALLQACRGSATISRSTAVSPAGNDLDAIEHVVFLMMENRSFDHFFGTYPGATGFDDHPSGKPWAVQPGLGQCAGGPRAGRAAAALPARRRDRLGPMRRRQFQTRPRVDLPTRQLEQRRNGPLRGNPL